jgi:T5SS/PEP-CTERM-associated repeat protein
VHDGAHLVTNRAQSVTNSSGIIGWLPSGQGSVTVNGANSLWTGDGTVNIGFRGAGILNIQQGSRVESANGVLARLPESTGDVTVTGNNSAWFVQNALYVGGRPASLSPGSEGMAGPGGAATLTAETGAFVAVGNSIDIFHGGTVDVSGGGSVIVGEGAPEAEAGVLHVYPTGVLTGAGQVDGDVINEGLAAPGNSIGTLNVDGDYTQSSSGVLDIEVAGVGPGQFDTISASGAAALAGLLKVSLIGFAPSLGDTFGILFAGGGFGGRFDALMLPPLPAGLGWRLDPGGATLFLNVVNELAGDFNADGVVDGADLLRWKSNFGTGLGGDADRDGDSDGNDFLVWQRNSGSGLSPGHAASTAVPEPMALPLLGVVGLASFVDLTINKRRRG